MKLSVVTFDPLPHDVEALRDSIQCFPKVLVLYRLSVRCTPAIVLPFGKPFLDALDQVDAIAVESNFVVWLNGSKRFNSSHDFHAIIR